MNVIYYTYYGKKSIMTDSIIKGIQILGHKCNHVVFKNKYHNCDFVILSGWNKIIKKINDYYINKGIKTLCITDGYINRGTDLNINNGYYAITRNNINSYGTHEYENNLPDDRWKKLNIELKNWNKNGNKIIIAHQHGLTANFKSRSKFFDNIISQSIKSYNDIIICLHPKINRKNINNPIIVQANKDYIRYSNMGCKIMYNQKTNNFFDDCKLLITYDSNISAE